LSQLPDLPSWDTIPRVVPLAIREIKRAIRERIEANGRTVESVVEEIESFLRVEIADVEATRARGENVWPVIEFADLAAGTVSAEMSTYVKRRGCAVIRGTFDRAEAQQWDADIVEYVEGNRFFENYRGPADDFFSSVDSKPEIYPIYWSKAQMEARQHPHMAIAQQFLNSHWTSTSNGTSWFDPAQDTLYPDRIRRRPPGTTSAGLGHHLDPGTLDLWMSGGYQQAFRHVFAGDFAAYDPWDASFRTDAAQYPGTTMCSAFRTFQGWTALSDMRHDQGVLHTIPIPKAFAYLLLRPLLDDVPDDEMCGVRLNRAMPVRETWHSLLTPASSGIPDVQLGDTVWWHCDMIHSVAPVENQEGWGNVMYIPAAPACAKNERYAASVRSAFAAGMSPDDFPAEHYEVDWTSRFRVDQLNDIGRRGLGLKR
jgi:Protein of unknown function (DUF1479)